MAAAIAHAPAPRVALLCADGLTSVERVLGQLGGPLPFAVLVACTGVEHVAAALRAVTERDVVEVAAPALLVAGSVYAVPATAPIAFDGARLSVRANAGAREPFDHLLRAFADAFGESGTAVVLAGRGTGGSLGIKSVKEAGGATIAEVPPPDPRGELPEAAIATGTVDFVLPLDAIGPQLLALEPAARDAAQALDADARSDELADTVREILVMVRVRTGHDFAAYKRATLYRRIARRMLVCQTSSLLDYQSYLRDHPPELAHLLGDFLISVTSFFRDREAFLALERTVIPKLFSHRLPTEQVRVWVAGCATGEEAYSIAMLLLEHAAHLREPPHLQIFATDIDEPSLAVARAGRYPASIHVDVSPARLERFFVREAGGYRVAKELRELVLFSPHNLLRDPPFSRLDLITCRNVLIYLNRDAQDRVLNTFHFGLRLDGFLFLGSSEAAETPAMQFATLDASQRIFTRRLAPSTLGLDSLVAIDRWQAPLPLPDLRNERPISSFGELHHRVVELYAPPSLLVNDELDVVHVSEHAGAFLELQGGEPTRQLLRLAHPALRFELRSAVYSARQDGSAVEVRTVEFDDHGRTRVVELRARAVDLPQLGRGTLLITFEELANRPDVRTSRGSDAAIEPIVRELENELGRTRERLQSTIEQYETSLEELKASNEELQAINEELRSTTEELETSKEELQSVNEELITLNHELKTKIEEISRANSDLRNLMASTDIGVLFLDRELHIKRFTPRAQDLFNVIPSDVGRPFAHLTHRLDLDDMPAAAAQVLRDLRPIERAARTPSGRHFLARLLPYRSLEDRIEGVVLTFADVTALKAAETARDMSEAARDRSEAALRATENRLFVALRAAPVVIVNLDETLTATWGYARGRELDASDRPLSLFAVGDRERFLDAAQHVRDTGASEQIICQLFADGEPRAYDIRIEASALGITAVGFDITKNLDAERSLRDADRRKDEFLATLSHELRNPLTPLRVALDVAKLAHGDPDKVERSLGIMSRQVDHLNQIVDELLDLSRITQGKIQLDQRSLDLGEVLRAALEATAPLVADNRHELAVALPASRVMVYADYARLVQVFVNLLTNAAKYTPPGGHLALALGVVGARAVVHVCDDGVGIEPALLPHVFELFVQSRDTVGRARGGLGIGLNLVRRLVELHGGTVAARSDGEGRGSELVVELPLIEER